MTLEELLAAVEDKLTARSAARGELAVAQSALVAAQADVDAKSAASAAAATAAVDAIVALEKALDDAKT